VYVADDLCRFLCRFVECRKVPSSGGFNASRACVCRYVCRYEKVFNLDEVGNLAPDEIGESLVRPPEAANLVPLALESLRPDDAHGIGSGGPA